MADERGWNDTIVHETPAKPDDSPFRWRPA
jgi:hypothetical protein